MSFWKLPSNECVVCGNSGWPCCARVCASCAIRRMQTRHASKAHTSSGQVRKGLNALYTGFAAEANCLLLASSLRESLRAAFRYALVSCARASRAAAQSISAVSRFESVECSQRLTDFCSACLDGAFCCDGLHCVVTIACSFFFAEAESVKCCEHLTDSWSSWPEEEDCFEEGVRLEEEDCLEEEACSEGSA